jgi:hypothetical protein
LTEHMHDIDFLPSYYRAVSAHRRSQAWRLGVAGVLTLALGTTALAQWRQLRHAEQALAELAPRHAAAEAIQERLAETQARLREANQRAELVTYLRHPWPRSQIVTALIGPLPSEATLEKMHIHRETVSEAAQRQDRSSRKQAEAELAALPPVQRTLLRLRDEYDHSRVIIELVGSAADSGGLHHYLGQLDADPLFERVQLLSVERMGQDAPQCLRFQLRLVVRPSYGQIAGPTTALSPESRDFSNAMPQGQAVATDLPGRPGRSHSSGWAVKQ